MDDSIIKTGDMLSIQLAPPTVVPQLQAPVSLTGTAKVLINSQPACLRSDVEPAPMALRVPMPYTSPPFVTPGTGMLTLQLTPANFTKRTNTGNGPLVLKGMVFQAKFTVQVPAMQPTPAGPVSDPMMEKMGTAQFITTNETIRAR